MLAAFSFSIDATAIREVIRFSIVLESFAYLLLPSSARGIAALRAELTTRTSDYVPQQGNGAVLQRSSHLAQEFCAHGEGRRNLTLSQHRGVENYQDHFEHWLWFHYPPDGSRMFLELALFQQSPAGSSSEGESGCRCRDNQNSSLSGTNGPDSRSSTNLATALCETDLARTNVLLPQRDMSHLAPRDYLREAHPSSLAAGLPRLPNIQPAWSELSLSNNSRQAPSQCLLFTAKGSPLPALGQAALSSLVSSAPKKLSCSREACAGSPPTSRSNSPTG